MAKYLFEIGNYNLETTPEPEPIQYSLPTVWTDYLGEERQATESVPELTTPSPSKAVTLRRVAPHAGMAAHPPHYPEIAVRAGVPDKAPGPIWEWIEENLSVLFPFRGRWEWLRAASDIHAPLPDSPYLMERIRWKRRLWGSEQAEGIPGAGN